MAINDQKRGFVDHLPRQKRVQKKKTKRVVLGCYFGFMDFREISKTLNPPPKIISGDPLIAAPYVLLFVFWPFLLPKTALLVFFWAVLLFFFGPKYTFSQNISTILKNLKKPLKRSIGILISP